MNGKFLRLTAEERILTQKECPMVKPTCPPGSMILWDSRTIHDPDDGSDHSQGRFVVYCCYSKFDSTFMNDSFMCKKRKAFQEFRATEHSPYPQRCFPKSIRTYGREQSFLSIDTTLLNTQVDEKTNLQIPNTILLKQLYGFLTYEKDPSKNWANTLFDQNTRKIITNTPQLLTFPSMCDVKTKGKSIHSKIQKKRKSLDQVGSLNFKKIKKY